MFIKNFLIAISTVVLMAVASITPAVADVDITSENFPLRINSDAWNGPTKGFDRSKRVQWFLEDPENVAALAVTMMVSLKESEKDIGTWMREKNIPVVLNWYAEDLDYDIVTESAGEIAPEGRSVRFQTITYHLKIGKHSRQDRQIMFFYTELPEGWFWMVAMNQGQFRPFAFTDKVNEIVEAVSVGRRDIARMNN